MSELSLRQSVEKVTLSDERFARRKTRRISQSSM